MRRHVSREDGFYWVRYCGKPRIGEYHGDQWRFTDGTAWYEDEDFEAIGERLTPPEGL